MEDHRVLILNALRANAENLETRNGETWGSVYLDNIKLADMDPRKFAGYLRWLQRLGVYKDEPNEFKGIWGRVRMP